jgi:hypothetical protein
MYHNNRKLPEDGNSANAGNMADIECTSDSEQYQS